MWIGLKFAEVLEMGRADVVQTSLFGPAKSFILDLQYPPIQTQCLLMEITNQADLCGSLGGGVILYLFFLVVLFLKKV